MLTLSCQAAPQLIIPVSLNQYAKSTTVSCRGCSVFAAGSKCNFLQLANAYTDTVVLADADSIPDSMPHAEPDTQTDSDADTNS
jgi:hypothetical protein